MKEVKRWILVQKHLELDDVLWLRGLGCGVNVSAKEPITMDLGSHQHTFSNLRSNQIQVLTTTPKQEIMLQLKYSKDILLASVVYLQDGEVYQDNFGTITG